MILALSAMMMAAGSVTVNAQEKVVTLDQLLKKNQEQKQAQTPQKQEQKAKPETKQQTQKQPKEKAQKQPKSSAAAAGLMAPVAFSSVYLQYNFESEKVKAGIEALAAGKPNPNVPEKYFLGSDFFETMEDIRLNPAIEEDEE